VLSLARAARRGDGGFRQRRSERSERRRVDIRQRSYAVPVGLEGDKWRFRPKTKEDLLMPLRAKSKKAVRALKQRKTLEKLRELESNGQCEGECEGLYLALKVVKGKCPDPCDAEILKKLEEEAKKQAKKQADELCKGKVADGKCACDGQYVTNVKSCETQTVENCGDVCIYYVDVGYVGECKKPQGN
jgi:hypothetical protein